MLHPEVFSFFDEPTNTASYVLKDPASNAAAIIDSVLDYDAAAGRTSTKAADEVIAFVKERSFDVQWLLETHVHADHLSAAPYLKEKLGGKIAIGANITIVQDVFGKVFNAGTEFERDGSQFDALFKDGDRIRVGEMTGHAMHTPGHTPACMTYVFGDAAFIGDTLFMPDYGTARADFPGGSARDLYRSIRKVLALPPETRLFLCHDYKAPGRDAYAWETTVAEQRKSNIHVRDGVTEDEYVAMREARDKTLGMPKLIIPSIQVNMRAGDLPKPEDNGVRYLKVPLNKL
ncbi:MBL fold metallo-hydrolase [Hyphomicrobium sp. CS1BSMeth3]|uniref:MBL fold metallo-hydrolase n=1 Tax=Hyphomicrobium sp. CS1BSMeth3 TaxID=1892844 RepID=UPI0009304EF3|nr:MBL fold metallo-hydrolase [Hyphomicrobium sp. CS1BSMeth3]